METWLCSSQDLSVFLLSNKIYGTTSMRCRAGRAGRGSLPGTSVLLCSSTELHRLRDVEHAADISFERRSLPALADCKELFLRQLICRSAYDKRRRLLAR